MLTVQDHVIPEGPPDVFVHGTDLRVWIERNFQLFGDLFRAKIFGTNVYVVSSPEYA